MEIVIPRNLDLESGLDFCNKINETDLGLDRINFDYKNMKGNLEPLGMLLVGSKIREINKMYEINLPTASNYENKSYAANIGFFQSVNLAFGKDGNNERGTNNFIRITGENILNSYSKAMDIGYGTDITRYIEEIIAEDISTVLSRGDLETKEVVRFCIVEVIRNIYDHSRSNELWYTGQYWPTKELVEIAILDEGEGIFHTLKNNNNIIVNNSEEALKLALIPGISKSSSTMRNRQVNGNSGFGLFMIKEICDLVGSFTIISSGKCLKIADGNMTVEDINFNGTAIRIRIDTSRLKNMDIVKLRRKLSIRGTNIVRKLSHLNKISVEIASELGVM